jgi:hypothetical protein
MEDIRVFNDPPMDEILAPLASIRLRACAVKGGSFLWAENAFQPEERVTK